MDLDNPALPELDREFLLWSCGRFSMDSVLMIHQLFKWRDDLPYNVIRWKMQGYEL
jgi:hypothetical protein